MTPVVVSALGALVARKTKRTERLGGVELVRIRRKLGLGELFKFLYQGKHGLVWD